VNFSHIPKIEFLGCDTFLRLNFLIVVLKCFRNRTPNRIGRLRIRLRAIRGLKQENKTIIQAYYNLSRLSCKPVTNFRTSYYPRFMVGLGQVDFDGNHLQLMVGLDCKKIIFFIRE
jgi:hypothetical protein